MESAGPISFIDIQLLTATTHFVTILYYTRYVVLSHALFLVGVESGRPVFIRFSKLFSDIMMSKRSSIVITGHYDILHHTVNNGH